MGVEQDDAYAARRAELDRRFSALPPAESPAYWQAIETHDPAGALPLEVLGRCFRERWAAGARADSEHVYTAIGKRVQARVVAWARSLARQAPQGQQATLAEDLAQECYVALWDELADANDSFLLEGFVHSLDRIQRHTAHAIMEREGLWRRHGVQKPTRVPRTETERLDAPGRDEESTPANDRIFDVGAEDAFERVELESDVRALLDSLPPEDRDLLYYCYWCDIQRDEVARQLGVTDRTVRNRLSRIYAVLRRLLDESQEDGNG